MDGVDADIGVDGVDVDTGGYAVDADTGVGAVHRSVLEWMEVLELLEALE